MPTIFRTILIIAFATLLVSACASQSGFQEPKYYDLELTDMPPDLTELTLEPISTEQAQDPFRQSILFNSLGEDRRGSSEPTYWTMVHGQPMLVRDERFIKVDGRYTPFRSSVDPSSGATTYKVPVLDPEEMGKSHAEIKRVKLKGEWSYHPTYKAVGIRFHDQRDDPVRIKVKSAGALVTTEFNASRVDGVFNDSPVTFKLDADGHPYEIRANGKVAPGKTRTNDVFPHHLAALRAMTFAYIGSGDRDRDHVHHATVVVRSLNLTDSNAVERFRAVTNSQMTAEQARIQKDTEFMVAREERIARELSAKRAKNIRLAAEADAARDRERRIAQQEAIRVEEARAAAQAKKKRQAYLESPAGQAWQAAENARRAEEARRLEAGRAAERRTWPSGARGKLSRGALVCTSVKGAAVASAYGMSNKDCDSIFGDRFISSMYDSGHGRDIKIVRIIGGGQWYVNGSDIEQ